jgi:MIP family channel proteins
MVLIGTAAVATAVLTGALPELWQVAVVWAVGVTVAIYISAPMSGAHLNPAVSLALALYRPWAFPMPRLASYWVFQLAGATLAGVLVLLGFGPALAEFETREGLTRGEDGSERAAMIFGEYFPNPAMFGTGPQAAALVSPWQAFAVEALGTGLLILVILALTDRRSRWRLPGWLIPPAIGLTVGALIWTFAPLTQAGWNPARDFGPRLVAWAAGFGSVALPGPHWGFWVYLLGPLLGASVAGLAYERVLSRLLSGQAIQPAVECAPFSPEYSALGEQRRADARTESSPPGLDAERGALGGVQHRARVSAWSVRLSRRNGDHRRQDR